MRLKILGYAWWLQVHILNLRNGFYQVIWKLWLIIKIGTTSLDSQWNHHWMGSVIKMSEMSVVCKVRICPCHTGDILQPPQQYLLEWVMPAVRDFKM